MNVSNLARDYRLFIDTNTFMHEKAERFFSSLYYNLIENQKKLIIPHKVLIEIEQLQKSLQIETKSAAIRGAKILKRFRDKDLIDLRGDKNNQLTDNVYHFVFSKFRTQYNLALLTQDKAIAYDILALKNSKGIQSLKKLAVLKLDKNGVISEWQEKQSLIPTQNTPVNNTPSAILKFRICSKPRSQKNQILKIREIPKEGDLIDAGEFGRIRLIRILGEGGEGKIFLTDTNLACKIYFKERLTQSRYAKLNLMVDRKIKIPGVCWPLAIAKNSYNEFVGYLMPVAEGIPMQKSVFIKPLLEKRFPHWSRRNLVQLAMTWLETTIKLHSLNILIGDINPLNFLIKSEQELFFVDTDSYQIEDFPCPVGMVNFTAPEIQKLDFSTFLRNPNNEYFAIATLLFMILLPGKPPYSHQGGGDPLANIKKGEFSYPFGGKSNKKTPEGPWRFIWSHLPYKTKEAFYNCFVNNQRISADKWLELMESYKYAIDKGRIDPNGGSDRIFPSGFKGVSGYAKEFYNAEDKTYEFFTCDCCNKSFDVKSEYAEKLRKLPQKLCRDCFKVREIENTTGDIVFCSQCGEKFLISISERKYFNQFDLSQPKRCKSCRDYKKNNYTNTAPVRKISKTGSSATNSFWEILNDILKNI